MRAVAAVVAFAAALASASSDFVLHESVRAPAPWQRSGDAAADALLQLTVAVKLQGTEELLDTLYAVSTPGSPRYGQHLSKAAVDALVTPAPASLAAVKGWFASAGIVPHSVNGAGEYLTAVVTVAQAEALLSTQYSTWTRESDGAAITRCEEYSLPAAVAAHVDFVAPTTRFPATSSLRVRTHAAPALRGGADSSSYDDGAGAGAVTPDVIAKLYSTAGASTQGALQGNKIAITSFLGQFFSPTDLAAFFKQYAPTAAGNTPTVHGPNDASSPGVEAQLDVEYAFSTAPRVPAQAWSTPGQQPGSPENEPFLTWLHNITALPDSTLPQAVSASYGDNEDSVVFAYAQRVNVAFQKLGARGVSIMFGSGDGGVAGAQPRACPGGRFVATFPAASPFVTAVGGTVRLGATDGQNAASLTGGGFSDYWPRPAFQDAAVAAYKASGVPLPPAHLFNATGAAFPDVAAFAENFAVLYKGSTIPVSGTSAATPTFSAVVALVNGARLAAGKAPLGWLNPFIYANAGAWTDITAGTNPGCGTQGFTAAAGWDPLTGWGSPDYAKFVKAALAA